MLHCSSFGTCTHASCFNIHSPNDAIGRTAVLSLSAEHADDARPNPLNERSPAYAALHESTQSNSSGLGASFEHLLRQSSKHSSNVKSGNNTVECEYRYRDYHLS